MISSQDVHDVLVYDVYIVQRSEREYSSYLTDAMKDLLELYVPNIFNAYTGTTPLKEVLVELLNLYLEYETNKPNPKEGVISANQLEAIAYDESIIPNKKKSRDEQLKIFKTKLEDLCSYLGGSYYGTEKGKYLKQLLKEAYHNPDDYVPKRRKTTISKMTIKSYLVGLGIPSKTNIIENFIKEIK